MALTAFSKHGQSLLNESSVDLGVALRFLMTRRLEVWPLLEELVRLRVALRIRRLEPPDSVEPLNAVGLFNLSKIGVEI